MYYICKDDRFASSLAANSARANEFGEYIEYDKSVQCFTTGIVIVYLHKKRRMLERIVDAQATTNYVLDP